ncbi:type VII toxin-antitoxin system MntA family adenylyltransferase antitoxin [Natranaerofaba carboxydovora]|uniref:type VII toxin-antitoxin system MntA family adenylyltransferase antitoxin n=1 Tax=Natranaerofaba carboxydovora TaxID=2742683 RepID=UPI001F1472D6|nr:nucleotidyltransferase domain-containing protein [Natranaerofaba carboxydovora]UMZ74972.1 Nucleotidyltransferase domain protein [Natranaerofaba carboxydovora]
MITKEEIEKKLDEFFQKEESVACSYLFGSRIKEKARDNSDIDVAILFEEGIPLMKRFDKRLEYAYRLQELFDGVEVDVVDLESCDLYFIYQVLSQKKIVHEKNINRRVTFEVINRKKYFDMKHFYNTYNSKMLERRLSSLEEYYNDLEEAKKGLDFNRFSLSGDT